MAGINQIEDVLNLVEVIGVSVGEKVHEDGFQVTDLLAFLQSADFAERLKEALDGIQEIPEEATDIGVFEGVELITKVKDVSFHIYNAFTGAA